MIVSWISAGVSSFIAAYLVRNELDKAVYIDVANQHPDSLRFIRDIERVLGINIEILRDTKYAGCVDNVISDTRYINGPNGARCTAELKKRVRHEWELANLYGSDITYVWGYDVNEKNRADRLQKVMFEYKHLFPLIENGITKSQAHAICQQLGVKRPVMYDLGYSNNNCIGCVKGGMGYWNKIRKDFPSVFKRRAEREREIGHSCIKGVFLDELDPNRGRDDEVVPDCSFTCEGNEGIEAWNKRSN